MSDKLSPSRGNKPKLRVLLDWLPDDEREALEAALSDPNMPHSVIERALADEAAEVAEKDAHRYRIAYSSVKRFRDALGVQVVA